MIKKRVGFACKWSEQTAKGVTSVPDLNMGGTTIAWLNRQHRDIAEQKLWDLMKQNIEATRQLVKKVGGLDESLRMVRIGSDMLPAYTESSWSYFWRRSDVANYCSHHLGVVGDLARQHDVRLSFHPGQFCVLASDRDDVVVRSIEEFEYHADMARWMGFGKKFQDFKINVHISGRRGPQGIREAYKKLTPEARNCITIENEENSWGLDECLTLGDLVPIVLDIHHNWIREGEYIEASDERVKKVIDSWRGVRPTIHYSLSREDILTGHSRSQRPDLCSLLAASHKKQKLRAHSDFMWNDASNVWAKEHWAWADVMVESKAKNLASFKLFESWK